MRFEPRLYRVAMITMSVTMIGSSHGEKVCIVGSSVAGGVVMSVPAACGRLPSAAAAPVALARASTVDMTLPVAAPDAADAVAGAGGGV